MEALIQDENLMRMKPALSLNLKKKKKKKNQKNSTFKILTKQFQVRLLDETILKALA